MRVLFLLKPLFYVLAFAVAQARFKAYGPHSKLSRWATVVLASLSRIVLGVVGFFVIWRYAESGYGFYVSVFGLGFVWWVAVATFFFQRTPPKQIVAFAVIGEILSAAIDYATVLDLKDFHMC